MYQDRKLKFKPGDIFISRNGKLIGEVLGFNNTIFELDVMSTSLSMSPLTIKPYTYQTTDGNKIFSTPMDTLEEHFIKLGRV